MEYYNVEQAANKLGLCRETVRRWARVRKIPNERKGRKFRFSKHIIDNFYVPQEVLNNAK